MKYIYQLLILPVFFLNFAEGVLASPLDEFNKHFEKSVKKHWRPSVKIHGISTTVFDYAGISKDFKNKGSDFRKALKALKSVDINKLKKGNVEKAFWVNVYNFGAMKLVADHYPIDSIRSMKISLVKYPWSVKAIQVGKNKYSLKEIEKDILLKRYNDPRVVFAVSCAAVSCPDRTNEIFYSNKFNEQVDSMVKDFFKNTRKGLYLDKKSKIIKLAWILKKDGHLFKDEKGVDVLGFVKKYVEPETENWISKNKKKIKIKYFDHDWGLNDLALKDKN